MVKLNWPGNAQWSLLEKIVFRFFFIYFILHVTPWTWTRAEGINEYYDNMIVYLVKFANKEIFHFYDKLVLPNGSGDTSFNWTEVALYLLIALAGCLFWSVADRKRANYNRLSYWLRIFVRYFVIINCFNYGIIKLFSLQMPFPNLSQLSTPLGDFLPMRLSWMNMGYSTKYQVFSGAMEVLAGLLLLYRRTITFGLLLAAGVFANVMWLNISYDIPVKLFSTHLFAMCLFLLAFDYKRILNFFVNNPVVPTQLYNLKLPKLWMRIGRIVLKCLFVLSVVIIPFFNSLDRYKNITSTPDTYPIKSGVYEVNSFVLNNDTLPPLITDTLRWQDMIFEKGNGGSIKTADTSFRQRYGRGYFTYSINKTNDSITLRKTLVSGETWDVSKMDLKIPDPSTVILNGLMNGKTIQVTLRRTNRHFQLTERQFHWLSEYNR